MSERTQTPPAPAGIHQRREDMHEIIDRQLAADMLRRAQGYLWDGKRLDTRFCYAEVIDPQAQRRREVKVKLKHVCHALRWAATRMGGEAYRAHGANPPLLHERLHAIYGTEHRLKRWIGTLLKNHGSLEDWLLYEERISVRLHDRGHRIKTQTTRRAWMDWMINQLEKEKQ